MRKFFVLAVFVLAAEFAFAKNPPKEVLNVAREAVPENAKFKNFESDDNEYELLFLDKEGTAYKVEVSKFGNKLKKLEIESSRRAESKEIKLQPKEIKSLIQEKFPDADSVRINLDSEGNRYKYEVEFSIEDRFKAEIEINPSTGEFCKQEFEY